MNKTKPNRGQVRSALNPANSPLKDVTFEKAIAPFRYENDSDPAFKAKLKQLVGE